MIPLAEGVIRGWGVDCARYIYNTDHITGLRANKLLKKSKDFNEKLLKYGGRCHIEKEN